MKALIQKDVYVLWKQMRIFLLVMLVIMVGNGSFGSVFVVLWCSMLPYTALAYDERCKWDQMAAMMPYSPRDLVLSKYVLGWLCAGAASAIVLAVQAIIRVLHLSMATGTPLSVLMSFCASASVLAVTLPLMIRFSVERGRMVMFLVIFLVCGAAGALGTVAISVDQTAGGIQDFLGLFVLILPVAAVVLTAVSIPLSMRLYAARL